MREALPVVQEGSEDPPGFPGGSVGCSGVVRRPSRKFGRPSQISGRPSQMSGSCREAFSDVRESLPVVRVWSEDPPRFPGGPVGCPGVVGRPSR